MRASELTPELFGLLQECIHEGSVVTTLSAGNPNRISSLDRAGIRVETGRTQVAGTGPQLVPAWMIEAAWRRLKERGRLSYAELVATNDLNVKRSSFVCALLACLPAVTVASQRPIVLTLAQDD
jgi:hypothetical protein